MKAIFIVGPTATGKTALALALVPFLLKFPGMNGVDLISADSKQVYLGQDMVTGKDMGVIKERLSQLEPQNRTRVSFYGVDLVHPDEEWSVAHFLKFVRPLVLRAQANNRWLVFVGGTGLYLNSLLAPPSTAMVARDTGLRSELETLSVSSLQQRLKALNPAKLDSLNNSDRNNPRRLVRAIEVAQSPSVGQRPREISSSCLIGLMDELPSISEKIMARVRERLDHGAIEETMKLSQTYPDWTSQAKSAIGYSEIERYLKGELSREALENLWSLHERQYAKRQMTWFAKLPGIKWFGANEKQLSKKVEEYIKTCYTL